MDIVNENRAPYDIDSRKNQRVTRWVDVKWVGGRDGYRRRESRYDVDTRKIE